MAKIDYLPSYKKLKPKKETIEFILAFSKSQASLVTTKQKRFMVCKN